MTNMLYPLEKPQPQEKDKSSRTTQATHTLITLVCSARMHNTWEVIVCQDFKNFLEDTRGEYFEIQIDSVGTRLVQPGDFVAFHVGQDHDREPDFVGQLLAVGF